MFAPVCANADDMDERHKMNVAMTETEDSTARGMDLRADFAFKPGIKVIDPRCYTDELTL